jgi:hypothetical protein
VAKARTAPADDFKPVEGFAPAASFGAEVDGDNDFASEIAAHKAAPPLEPDPRDAEIERLRAELATYKQAAPLVAGGCFTLSWKDGPTVTIDVLPGERPEDALQRYGVHSVPHKISVQPAPDDAPRGRHSPGGVRPFGFSAQVQQAQQALVK